MHKPMISLCMIVKNEESCLGRALDSAAGLYDELIVVDTGSTDGTVDIARRYGAQLIPYDWQAPGHKGAARMAGIDRAGGEWVVVLDADEIITDARGLRRFLLNPPEPMTGVNVKFQNYNDNGALTLTWYQIRCFRRGLYRYIHREHEMPHYCGNGTGPVEVGLDVVFEHRAPAGRAVGKAGPMMERLRLDVAEHPGDPHPLYFYHRQHVIAGDWAAGLEWGEKYVALSGDHDRCECYGNMAICAYELGDAQAAIEWLHRAAAAQPDRRIWWVRLAEIYAAGAQWNLAAAHLLLAAALAPSFEWQWEPGVDRTHLLALIEQYRQATVVGEEK